MTTDLLDAPCASPVSKVEEALRRQNQELKNNLSENRAAYYKELSVLRAELSRMESGKQKLMAPPFFESTQNELHLQLQEARAQMQEAKLRAAAAQEEAQVCKERSHTLKAFALKRAQLFDRAMQVLKVFAKRQGHASVAHYLKHIRDDYILECSAEDVTHQIEREQDLDISFDQAWLEACLDTLDPSIPNIEELEGLIQRQSTADASVQTCPKILEVSVQTHMACLEASVQTSSRQTTIGVQAETHREGASSRRESPQRRNASPPRSSERRRSSVLSAVNFTFSAKSNRSQETIFEPPESDAQAGSISSALNSLSSRIRGLRRKSVTQLESSDSCSLPGLPGDTTTVERGTSPVQELCCSACNNSEMYEGKPDEPKPDDNDHDHDHNHDQVDLQARKLERLTASTSASPPKKLSLNALLRPGSHIEGRLAKGPLPVAPTLMTQHSAQKRTSSPSRSSGLGAMVTTKARLSGQ
mmetsp:Transcript_140/g.309  ORF Transcript_140/g.309 Transcript_140/m.309 type:complete len:473 (-) Transcript_140:230-1648(-)